MSFATNDFSVNPVREGKRVHCIFSQKVIGDNVRNGNNNGDDNAVAMGECIGDECIDVSGEWCWLVSADDVGIWDVSLKGDTFNGDIFNGEVHIWAVGDKDIDLPRENRGIVKNSGVVGTLDAFGERYVEELSCVGFKGPSIFVHDLLYEGIVLFRSNDLDTILVPALRELIASRN
ncbi:30901_t:CDS:1 [Gigaspora margarita]|uniref:30901_t:CDS:1 n=1 Tax=Gigaspora margarita TaxID=4874 RepID=A0ABN7VQ24_GIGMA|nr:30901_t:CDS:1 [Gigaspora margarita]